MATGAARSGAAGCKVDGPVPRRVMDEPWAEPWRADNQPDCPLLGRASVGSGHGTSKRESNPHIEIDISRSTNEPFDTECRRRENPGSRNARMELQGSHRDAAGRRQHRRWIQGNMANDLGPGPGIRRRGTAGRTIREMEGAGMDSPAWIRQQGSPARIASKADRGEPRAKHRQGPTGPSEPLSPTAPPELRRADRRDHQSGVRRAQGDSSAGSWFFGAA